MTTYGSLLGAAALSLGIAFFGFGATQQAEAAFQSVTPTTSPVTLPDGDSFAYAPSPAGTILWSNVSADVVPQDPPTVGQKAANALGIDPQLVQLVGQSGANTPGTATGIGTNSGTFTADPFNILTIFYARKQITFYWPDAIPSFAIGTAAGGEGLAQDISNYRAYYVVPVPAALPLLLTALAALGIIGRRKMKATATA